MMARQRSPKLSACISGLAAVILVAVTPPIPIYATAAPNDPPAVWIIKRQRVLTPQTPMSMTALLTSLREKYGKETLTMTRRNDGRWDASGDADEVAARFAVSRAWVHRLIQRRRETGSIAPRKETKFRG
jgi:hypothetical protein